MMNEKIEFLSEKPETLIKYGKTVVLDDKNLLNLEAENKKHSINKKNTEQILNIILPPIYFKNDNNEQCFQKVETTPSKLSDISKLQKKLDEELIRNKAREIGICPIRENLYSECFDELIRQITINCSHRGIMLVRVRDELKNTIDTYQKLYLSSLGLGVRNALSGSNEENFLKNQIKSIEKDIYNFENEIDIIEQDLEKLKLNEHKQIQDINEEYQLEYNQVNEVFKDMKGKLKNVFSFENPK